MPYETFTLDEYFTRVLTAMGFQPNTQEWASELEKEIAHYNRIIPKKWDAKIIFTSFVNGFESGTKFLSFGEIEHWCKENCKGKYLVLSHLFIEFELESDAMMFKMRWL